MTGRQKIEAALSKEGAPEIAAVIPYEDIYIRDHWSQLTAYAWWYAFSPQVGQQMAWRREVFPAIGQDWMTLPACPSRAQREERTIHARGEGVFLANARTGEEIPLREPAVGGWESFERGGYSGHVERLADTPEAVDDLIPIREIFDADRFREEGRDDLARALLAEFGHLYPVSYAAAPLWRCYRLWGFEGMMAMVAEQPELVKHACERFLHNELVAVQEAAALGAAGIWIEDCLTDLIGPRAFQVLNLPYVRMLVETIGGLGMHSIYYFCGSPAGKLDLLLEAGADALSLEESKKGFTIDIAEVAESVRGRCALLGNLDAIRLLPEGSEQELRAEIARQAAAGRRNGGRFVMSLGSPVTPGTSPERVRRYCAMVQSPRPTPRPGRSS